MKDEEVMGVLRIDSLFGYLPIQVLKKMSTNDRIRSLVSSQTGSEEF